MSRWQNLPRFQFPAAKQYARSRELTTGDRPLTAALLADAESLYNRLVTLGIVPLQVVEQAASPANHHKQTSPGGVVFLVRLKVFRQLAYALT